MIEIEGNKSLFSTLCQKLPETPEAAAFSFQSPEGNQVTSSSCSLRVYKRLEDSQLNLASPQGSWDGKSEGLCQRASLGRRGCLESGGNGRGLQPGGLAARAGHREGL